MNLMLHEFIGENRDELIRRCRAQVSTRPAPPSADAESDDRGIPLFLDQLVEELRDGSSMTLEMREGAVQHGHDLLLQGFTVGEVVHDYGSICQAVTNLATERAARISTDDFRTLNRCLDNAIAGAVTEFAREQEVTRRGHARDLRILTNTAIIAFEALQAGNVGVAGTTGNLVLRSLLQLRTLIDRSLVEAAPSDFDEHAPAL